MVSWNRIYGDLDLVPVLSDPVAGRVAAPVAKGSPRYCSSATGKLKRCLEAVRDLILSVFAQFPMWTLCPGLR